jgi:hypothetical protein
MIPSESDKELGEKHGLWNRPYSLPEGWTGKRQREYDEGYAEGQRKFCNRF